MLSRLILRPAYSSRAARGICLFLLAGCGATQQDSGILTIEIKGLPASLGSLNFKIYKADCLGHRPCDTWLAQSNVSQSTTDTLPFRMQLPEEVMSLLVHLRIEATENPTACVSARATTTEAKLGADYAGVSLAVALDRTSLAPPFAVSVANACPLFYEKQGTGQGTLLLQRPSLPDVMIPAEYPDELPRATYVTVTAMPSGGSRFAGWAQSSVCANSANPMCNFYVNDQIKLIPKFELL